LIGGGIRYKKRKPMFINKEICDGLIQENLSGTGNSYDSKIINNKAKIFGSNCASYP